MSRVRHSELLSIAHFHGDHITNSNLSLHAVDAWISAWVNIFSPHSGISSLQLTQPGAEHSDRNLHRTQVMESDLENWLAKSVTRDRNYVLEGGIRLL